MVSNGLTLSAESAKWSRNVSEQNTLLTNDQQ